MSRLGPAVFTAFTLLLLTPFPTVAAAKAPASTSRAGKHHPRATELRARSRRRHVRAVKPAPATHRTRGLRGRGGAAPGRAAHRTTQAWRPAALAAALA